MTVGVVIESRVPGVERGETVWHPFGWRDLAVVDAAATYMNGIGNLRVLDTSAVSPQMYLGALGPMGLTAYAGP